MAQYYETMEHINGRDVSYYRVESDYYGNPRYVVHFLDIASDYATALKISREVGGQKYRAKWFGGGIVIQSYNIREDLGRIVNGPAVSKYTFEELNVGEQFIFNETLYIKRSTRTAGVVGSNRWFYFSKSDRITNKDARIK